MRIYKNYTTIYILSNRNATKRPHLQRRVRSFWSTSGIRRVTLATNPEATKSLPTTALVVYVSYFTPRHLQSM
jgi:hypothetical protein